MKQFPAGLASVVKSAAFQARSELHSSLLDTLGSIDTTDELASLLVRFVEIMARAIQEHVSASGQESISLRGLFLDGPLRDASNVFWTPWDRFVSQTWTYGLRRVDKCPFLLRRLPALQRYRLEAPAIQQIKIVLDAPTQQEEPKMSSLPDPPATLAETGSIGDERQRIAANRRRAIDAFIAKVLDTGRKIVGRTYGPRRDIRTRPNLNGFSVPTLGRRIGRRQISTEF
jgi:hypothetical protein